MTTRQERQEADEENRVDRRKISPDSERRIAEAIHHDDFKRAAEKYFEILTGDEIAEWEPWRDAAGEVTLSDTVDDEHGDKTVVVEVEVGDESATARVVDGSGSYRVAELHDGEYDLDAAVGDVFERDEETLERTTYEVKDSEIELEETTLMIDTQNTDIDDDVEGPTVTVTDLELSEGDDE